MPKKNEREKDNQNLKLTTKELTKNLAPRNPSDEALLAEATARGLRYAEEYKRTIALAIPLAMAKLEVAMKYHVPKPPLVFEDVWHRRIGWEEQLQCINNKLFELKFFGGQVWTGECAEQIWTGTLDELGFFIRDAKNINLIVGSYQYKRIFEAGLFIEENNKEGKLVENRLTEKKIKAAHDTAREDNAAYKRTRTPESKELRDFLQSIASK